MPLLMSSMLISVAVVWLMLDQLVRRKFSRLKAELPAVYNVAAAHNPDPIATDDPDLSNSALMPLAVDLARGRHDVVPFDALTETEQRLVLMAHAITRLPRWMVSYSSLRMAGDDRDIVRKLRQIHASRPEQKIQYFGSIRQHQKLRPASHSPKE